jgi:hypothetical protein
MATGYEAVVRIKPVDVSREREESLIRLIGENLSDQFRLSSDRSSAGDLVLSVTMVMLAADTSEVQIAARDAVALALARAGLTEQAMLLDDVEVRASS